MANLLVFQGEELLESFAGEFAAQLRSLAATSAALGADLVYCAVGDAGLGVAPGLAGRHRDVPRCELSSKIRDIPHVGREHRFLDLIAEPHVERLLPIEQLPTPLGPVIGLREASLVGARLDDGEAVLAHELVVGPLDLAVRAIARQRPARLGVVVLDVDVVVQIPACRIDMGDHHVVAVRVHPLSQLAAQLVDLLDVLRVGHIERVRMKALRVALGFDRAGEAPGRHPCVSGELADRPQRGPHRGEPIRARRYVAGPLLVAA